MTKREITQGNKLIAEFMGYSLNEDGNLCRGGIPLFKLKDLKYHHQWNWLMPVVEKIAEDYDFRITWMPTAINVTYIDRPDVIDGEITSMGGMTAIENTFLAVVRFVKWYKKQNFKNDKP